MRTDAFLSGCPARRVPEQGEPAGSSPEATQDSGAGAEDLASASARAFRSDLERIRFSPYFARLAAVTQVVSQGASGQAVHNRLTHTIKVTAIARAIAVALNQDADAKLLRKLSGTDPVATRTPGSTTTMLSRKQ